MDGEGALTTIREIFSSIEGIRAKFVAELKKKIPSEMRKLNSIDQDDFGPIN